MTGPVSGSEGMLTLLLGLLSPAPFTAFTLAKNLPQLAAYRNCCCDFLKKDVVKVCRFNYVCIKILIQWHSFDSPWRG